MLALVLGSGSASARFFDACAAPGFHMINVVQNTTVRNERIVLFANDTQENCDVEVAAGVTLKLENVRISVTNEKRIDFNGDVTSRLEIKNSVINACDSDVFGFASVDIEYSRLVDPPNAQSCDVKEIEPTGDLTVKSSFIETEGSDTDNDIVLRSSTGRLTVFGVALDATDDIAISSDSGPLSVSFSSLRARNTTGNPVGILIDGAGPVRVLATLLRPENGGSITVHGNPCSATANAPPVSCTP